jgi:geranylgeranyl pyrophosphate synthase
MCAYKTGTLARLSARLSALFAGGTKEQVEALSKFAESIGVAFQIQDDILNLVGARLAETKGQYGEDIHEGKRTLMVLHCLDTAPPEDAKRLEEILNQHPTEQAIINEAIALIEKSDSIAYARNYARGMIREAWAQVEQVLPTSGAKDKLKAFADFLVEREF